jgi:hypothetical protein
MKGSIFFSVTAAMLLLVSCTKEPLNNLTEEESRIYVTNFDRSADFESYKTFSIVDSVAVIDNSRLTAKEFTQWDQSVLNAIVDKMQERGFIRVSKDQEPDLGVNVSRIYNTYTGVVNYPDYYGGYYDVYDPFYWGYGGSSYYFPSYYDFYQVTEAALSIDLLDLKNAKTNNRIAGIWNGLVRGSGIFRSSNTEPQINVLFEQSPYLKTQQ